MTRSSSMLAAALSAAVLAATLGSAPSSAGAAVQARAADRSITFATFNVLTSERGGPAWAPRRKRALDLLRRTRADVVVIQEGGAFGRGAARAPGMWLARKTGYAVAAKTIDGFDAAGRPTHPERRQSPQLLYRADRFTVDVSNPAAVGGGGAVSSLVLRDRRTGYTFAVIGVHLVPGLTAEAEQRRADYLSRHLARRQRIADRLGYRFPSATYVVGDLNTDRTVRPARVGGYLGSIGLVDSYTTARKRTEARINTFNGRRRAVAASGRRLDQVWVPRGVRVTRWRQVVDVQDGRYVGTLASDHNPVVARVRY